MLIYVFKSIKKAITNIKMDRQAFGWMSRDPSGGADPSANRGTLGRTHPPNDANSKLVCIYLSLSLSLYIYIYIYIYIYDYTYMLYV